MIAKEELLRIKSWLKNKPMPPYQLEIKPTNNCNLKCITCKAMGKAEYKKEEELSFEIYKKMIKEAADIKIKNIHITGGGDPLTSETTSQIMRYIKELGMEGTLATNGTLFSKGTIKELVEIGWDNIAFSIDAPDKETNDYIKGKEGAFKKSVDNVRLFNYYKKSLNKNKPDLELRPVFNSYNYNKLVEYIKLAHSLDVKEVHVQPLRVKDKSFGKELMLSKKQKNDFKKYIKNVLKTASRFGININLNFFDDLLIEKSFGIKDIIKSYTQNGSSNPNDKNDVDKRREDKKNALKEELYLLPCYHPWFFMSIRPNGDMYPCSADMPSPFGNIKTDSIKEVWFSKRFDLLREQFIKKEIPDYCNLCCGLNLLTTKNIQKKL